MRSTSPVFTGLPTTIFEVMSRLAIEHGSINLGQGFPDVDGPEDVRAAAAKAIMDGPNQYPPMLGIPALREAVAATEKRFFGLERDPAGEVIVTSGATEALSDCIMALVEPGDEVVLFEPLYDCYVPLVERAGGIARFVRLAPPDWAVTDAALEAAFSDRTKLVLINNPLNPASKVFGPEELSRIAALVERFDAYVIADEVYEHLVFDGLKHIPFSSLPGMEARTLRVGSAGKTFSLTGWKVGYITGPKALIEPVAKAHQFTTFTTPPHLQKAVAEGLAKGDEYYRDLAGDLERKRDRLRAGLEGLGLQCLDASGSYFLTADIRPLGLGDDVEACHRMTREAKVTAIPVSAFYRTDPPRHFVRFCFCKRDAVLDEAVARLRAWIAGR